MSISAWKFTSVRSGYPSRYFAGTDYGTKDLTDSRWVLYNRRIEGGAYCGVCIALVYQASTSNSSIYPSGVDANTAYVANKPSVSSFAGCGTLYRPNYLSEAVYSDPVPATLYTRSITALAGGTLTSSVGYGYSELGPDSATPAASTGYRFLEWRNADGTPVTVRTGIAIDSTTNRITIASTLNEDIAVYAYFVKNTVYVSAVAPVGGSVSLYIDGDKQASEANVAVSTDAPHTIRVVAVPDYNYTFYSWALTGGNNSALADYSFTMQYNDVTATAIFDVRPSVTLAVSKENPSYGTVSVDWPTGSAAESGGAVQITAYTNVVYTARAVSADPSVYLFSGWYTPEDELIQTGADFVFTPDGTSDIALVAKFAERSNFSFSSNVSDGGDYEEGNPSEAAGNALVQTPAAPDFAESGNYLEGRTITLSAVPAAGWSVASWFINSEDAAYDQTIPAGGAPCPQEINVVVRANTVVTAQFAINTYAVTATVDAASADGGVCEVEYEVSSGVWAAMPEAGVPHGAKVRVSATPDEGFVPGGIYEGGVLVSDTVSLGIGIYNITTVANPRAFIVKFRAPVGIILSQSEAGLGGAVALDSSGATVITATGATAVTYNVVLGDTLTLQATALEGGHFKGWFDEEDEAFASPLERMGMRHDITATEPVNYVARFTDTASPIYVSIVNEPYGLGLLASSAGTEIDEATYVGWLGGAASTGGSVGINRFYQFPGVSDTVLSVVPLTQANFMKWQYRTLDKSGMSVTLGEWTDISAETVFATAINRHLQFRVIYYSDAPLPVRARYRDGSDVTNGALFLSPSGSNRSVTSIGVSAEFTQGTIVTVTAVPENGFLFAGWYSAATGGTLLSGEPSYLFDVFTETSVFARFAQDTDAIYMWEGGTANKMMEWRSKRYVATKPFNPSSARVYASKYPVLLKLFMCSSPDAPSPQTPAVSVPAHRQDGFRLPVARPDKYVELSVSASGEVTEVVISTSMGGLAQ